MYALVKKGANPKGEPTSASSVVFIGKKPVMNYVTACITFFKRGEEEDVIKARGRAINRAIDTAELLQRALVKNLKIKRINIDTEEIVRTEGRK